MPNEKCHALQPAYLLANLLIFQDHQYSEIKCLHITKQVHIYYKISDYVKIKPHKNQSVQQGIRRYDNLFENGKPNVTIKATLTVNGQKNWFIQGKKYNSIFLISTDRKKERVIAKNYQKAKRVNTSCVPKIKKADLNCFYLKHLVHFLSKGTPPK